MSGARVDLMREKTPARIERLFARWLKKNFGILPEVSSFWVKAAFEAGYRSGLQAPAAAKHPTLRRPAGVDADLGPGLGDSGSGGGGWD